MVVPTMLLFSFKNYDNQPQVLYNCLSLVFFFSAIRKVILATVVRLQGDWEGFEPRHALEVDNFMRYINLLTYLLTYHAPPGWVSTKTIGNFWI